MQTGAERAFEGGFSALRGARVAVICNPTSLLRRADRRGRRVHLVDALRQADIDVVRLFGPEHGIWATAQDMIGVDDGVDPVFSLPVRSLYGHDEDSLIPSPDALAGIDVVVFDVQDVGARYYTYAATLCMALEVSATEGTAVLVLDRANPLGGEVVEGNRVGAAWRSFVGWIDLPQRHAMTPGEIARLYVAEQGLDVRLDVVACRDWQIDAFLDEQPDEAARWLWDAPSPNMPTVETAVVYPGQCLIEGTTLSEGRGTTRPFQLVGAPWLDPRRFAAALEGFDIAGLEVRPTCFEPAFQKYAGQVCGGVALDVVDRRRFPSVRAGIAVIAAAMQVGGADFAWREEVYEFVRDRLAIDLLMGGPLAREALEAGAGVDAATADFAAAEELFGRRARPHLLYRRQRGVLAAGENATGRHA